MARPATEADLARRGSLSDVEPDLAHHRGGRVSVSYFQAVRIYSAFEVVLFSTLVVVWLGGIDEHAEMVLGWCHGIGWIVLCGLVAIGCRRGVFPWPLLAATVSPLGPVGSSVGIEVIRRRSRVASR
jgi:hypothetical protein